MEETITGNRYYKELNNLFMKAFRSQPFDTICSILRVGGMSDANWDPFEESREAMEDFNWILDITGKQRSERCQLRVALLAYCQLVEMTAPHEIIINLLRCANGERYIINPTNHLGRIKKNDFLSFIPPSAKMKFQFIVSKADEQNEKKLAQFIDTIFSDEIRNAFSHSDYIITDDYFRFSEGRLYKQIKIEDLQKQINECFEFYSAFMSLHRQWLRELSKNKRYHKWPQYEVLELLSDESGLYGFNVHFSNGSKSTYTRRKSGIEAINVIFERDGSLNFMCGPIDKLEPIWKIDGVPVENWEKLE